MSDSTATQTPAVIVKEPTWTCITLNQSFQNANNALQVGYNLSVSMAQFTFVEVDGVKTYNVAADCYTSAFHDTSTSQTLLNEEVTRADGSKATLFELISEVANKVAREAVYPEPQTAQPAVL